MSIEGKIVSGWLLEARDMDRSGKWRVDSSLELYGRFFSDLFRDLEILSEAKKPGRVLDIGSGKCAATVEMAQEFPDLSITATVLTPDIVPPLSERPKNLSIVATTVEDLGVKDRFDLILSLYGVAYTKSPEQAVTELDRVMSPGGVVQLILWGNLITFQETFANLGYELIRTYQHNRLKMQKPGLDPSPTEV